MKKRKIILLALVIVALVLTGLVNNEVNWYRNQLRTGTPIRHDNVNLEQFLILEELMGDEFKLLIGNTVHSHLGSAMHFLNRSYSFKNTPGLGFREGVVHYQDSVQAYIAFQGYLHDHEELDTRKPSLIHPEYKKDKSINWYAAIIPPDDTGIALNLFYAQYDDVIVFYEIPLPVSELDEEGFIELVKTLDSNARTVMAMADLVDPLLPTFTPLPGEN